MAIVTRGDGTVFYDGAIPGFGTAWEGLNTSDFINPFSGLTSREYIEATYSDRLQAAFAAGDAPFEIIDADFLGGPQIATFAGMTVSGVPGTLGDFTIPEGIFITSGNPEIPLYNSQSGFSQGPVSGSDIDLFDTLSAAFPGLVGNVQDTYAITATFRVLDPTVTALTFSIVFGSEEFPEFVDSYVDGAAVIIDGVNYALFGGSVDRPLSVTGTNVAGGFFYNNTTSTLTNGGDVLPGDQVVLPVEYDGISQLLTITAPLGAGVIGSDPTLGPLHTIKIVIGDTNDANLDSGIWIGNLDVSTSDNPFLGQTINFDDVPQAADFFSNDDMLDPDSEAAQDFIEEYGLNTYNLLVSAAEEGQIINDKDGDFDTELNGFGGDDEINGRDGDDVIAGNGGDDDVNGEGGTDTAKFSGNRNDYTIVFDGPTGALIVRDNRSGNPDGEDALTGIELLEFADGTISTDPFLPDPNDAPDNIRLSRTSLAEDTARWTTLGLFSATDADGDTLTYALTDDAGGKFAINGRRFITADTFDFETDEFHDITVAVSDGTTTVEQDFRITVGDVLEPPVNTAPTNLALTRSYIKENSAAVSSIGLFSATDAEGNSIKWKLLDNADSFRIVGNKLQSTTSFDYEAVPDHELTITVQAMDSLGASTVQDFTIEIRDVFEAGGLLI